jgi:hypothetical protein
VGLERDPLSLVRTTEELLGRKSSDSGQKFENTIVGIRQAHHGATYPQKLTLTSPTGGGRSVSIVRLRVQAKYSLVLELKIKECSDCVYNSPDDDSITSKHVAEEAIMVYGSIARTRRKVKQPRLSLWTKETNLYVRLSQNVAGNVRIFIRAHTKYIIYINP